jgi:hypothetical protein
MRQKWYALNVIALITLLLHKRRKKMPRYSGVVIKKEYFEIEVEAKDADEAKDLIGEASIENDPYDIDWEFYEGSLEEIENA